jgi:type II secretion system protein N
LVESFSGDISGAGSAELHGSEALANTVRLTLVGDGLALRVIQGAPVVHLGSVAGQLRLDGAVLTVERLSAHGGDVELNGGGVIRLAPALQNSTVELKLYLHPSASGHAHFGLFFSLLPHPPAEGPYYISGFLASPSIN